MTTETRNPIGLIVRDVNQLVLRVYELEERLAAAERGGLCPGCSARHHKTTKRLERIEAESGGKVVILRR